MMKGLIIFDFNRTLYDPEQQKLFPGVEEFLQDYGKQYALALIGKGDEKRASLIEELGITHLFSSITLGEEKEVRHFVECMHALGQPPSRTWSVGDRIKKDILLSNRAEITTVWFQNGKYEHEGPQNPEEQPKHVIHSFQELRKIIPL